MTKISWDQLGKRYYENGISQGVFYGSDAKGVPWNGLISVDQETTDTTEPLYFDGFKYGDVITLGDFEGKLTAFTYPDEFLVYDGFWDAEAGFYLTGQTKSRFGLSYRTEINNDQGQSIGYKIHLLYNLIAIPSTRTHSTLSLDNQPSDFEWDISAVPEEIDNFRPTAYVVIDSRKIDSFLLSDIEAMLYGTDEDDPKLPDLKGLILFVQKWGRLIITDLGDGLWEATTPLDGVITMLDETTFEIVSDTAIFLDANSYEISSSDKNVEDIWPP